MRVIPPKIFFDNRVDIAEYYPFTISISNMHETHMLLCESLQMAGRYILKFLENLKRSQYDNVGHINLQCIRTDGNMDLIRDFEPQLLRVEIGPHKISILFKDLRITDGIRIKSYIDRISQFKA